jgi:hypothetical protein
MVEQEDLFGSVVKAFLQKHDPNPAAGQLEQLNVKLLAALVRPPGPRHHKHNKIVYYAIIIDNTTRMILPLYF